MPNESAAVPISLTLVIPTFNRADLIAETVEHALLQTVPFSEIIIVDDGSTDNTTEVIAKFGNRVRLIRTANAGVQSARNTGVLAAGTDFVTLCDSDDLLDANFVSTIFPWLAARTDVDMVYANFRTFDAKNLNPDKFSLAPSGWFDGAKSDGVFFWQIPDLYIRTVAYQPLFPTGVSFRRQFYVDIKGYDVEFNRIGGEDWEFTLRAIASGHVALCALPLTRIRKHGGNDSGNPVRLLLGEVQILEHALATTAVAKANTGRILSSIETRRIDAFNTAFAAGDFATTNQVLTMLRPKRFDARFQMKKLISSLPAGLRDRLWRLTQQP